MSKTFEQIEREISTEFEGVEYDWTTGEDIIQNVLGRMIKLCDSGIDDGADGDDNYVMYNTFETLDGELTIRVFYGDVTREVGYVSVTN